MMRTHFRLFPFWLAFAALFLVSCGSNRKLPLQSDRPEVFLHSVAQLKQRPDINAYMPNGERWWYDSKTWNIDTTAGTLTGTAYVYSEKGDFLRYHFEPKPLGEIASYEMLKEKSGTHRAANVLVGATITLSIAFVIGVIIVFM